MSRRIRYRILTILILGVITSALSVAALIQLLSTSTVQRIERSRDTVVEEVDRIAKSGRIAPDGSTSSTLIGVRGGVWTTDVAVGDLPPEWGWVVRDVVQASRESKSLASREWPIATGTLVIAAKPLVVTGADDAPTRTAWSAFLVKPLPSLRKWQIIVSLLVMATVLLVATTLYSIVTMNRSASALRASLEALATNLRAPIPKPAVQELGGIADGIRELAESLAVAREKEERMVRELAHNERLAALGRVAAGVAHEVRNPLASIKLRLDLAATSTRLPREADEAVTHASAEIDRLDRLVADLLVVAGRATGPKRSTDIADLLRSRVDVLLPWASVRGVTLGTSGEARASVDADSISRAVDNLVRNAVEASPAGGRVDVRVVRTPSGIAVRIEDSGPGVPEARVPELFEPFFTTKPSGTGLGLALSRSIARAHGGDVSYVREGERTRFELTLDGPRGDGGEPARGAVS
ncbi:MAG: HAMP domain-containing sensor histidine kinase [Polyangiaceae bacterium]